ncbi:Polycystin-2 [Diplonema papillatum]|nr:Polycystin-2 [Diplonema papillatum]
MATPAPADAAPQFEGVSFAVSSKIAKKQSIRVRKESMRLKKEATKEYPSPAREAFACLGTEGIDAAEVDSTASTSGVVSVPLPAVLTVLERKIAKSSLSTDLLVYIPFMIAFTVFLTNGRDVTEVFYSVQAIKEELLSQPATPYDAYKTFADVKSISEYNAWLRTVFVPSLYHPCVGNESSLASSARPYKGNHLLLGAVRLRTILASNNSCTLDSALFGGDRGAGVCRGSHHDGESVELRFGRYNPLYPVSLEKTKESYLYQHTPCSEAAGGQYIVGDVTWYHCGGYIVDVPFSKACDAVLSLVDLLEAAPFVDEERARFASVEFFLHHPALHTFTSVKIYIEISPSGAVIPAAQLRSFLVWTESDSKGNTIFDFFFFAFVLYYLYKYVRDCILHKRSKGSLISFFLDVWNLLETANLLIFLVVFALRWTWWDVSKQKLTAFPYSPKYRTLPFFFYFCMSTCFVENT